MMKLIYLLEQSDWKDKESLLLMRMSSNIDDDFFEEFNWKRNKWEAAGKRVAKVFMGDIDTEKINEDDVKKLTKGVI